MKGVRSQPFGGEEYVIAEVPARFGGKWHCHPDFKNGFEISHLYLPGTRLSIDRVRGIMSIIHLSLDPLVLI